MKSPHMADINSIFIPGSGFLTQDIECTQIWAWTWPKKQKEEWGRAEKEAIEISWPLFSGVLLSAFPSVSSLGLIGKLLMCEASTFHSICRAVLCSFKGEKTHGTLFNFPNYNRRT